jgi:MYXO-CTERM domain-containing protein
MTLRVVSFLLLVVGLGLLAMMVVVEGEPGALPLALVLLGGVGLAFTRRRKAKAAAPTTD